MEWHSDADARRHDRKTVKTLTVTGLHRLSPSVRFPPPTCFPILEPGDQGGIGDPPARSLTNSARSDTRYDRNHPHAKLRDYTARLILRPYASTDIDDLVRLAGAREVAATTLRIPHPYTEQDARDFVAQAPEHPHLRPVLRSRDKMTDSSAGSRFPRRRKTHAELGYWLGLPYWGQGYATESTERSMDSTLSDDRIYVYVTPNVASGRVLRKIRMRHEGVMREHICKWVRFTILSVTGC